MYNISRRNGIEDTFMPNDKIERLELMKNALEERVLHETDSEKMIQLLKHIESYDQKIEDARQGASKDTSSNQRTSAYDRDYDAIAEEMNGDPEDNSFFTDSIIGRAKSMTKNLLQNGNNKDNSGENRVIALSQIHTSMFYRDETGEDERRLIHELEEREIKNSKSSNLGYLSMLQSQLDVKQITEEIASKNGEYALPAIHSKTSELIGQKKALFMQPMSEFDFQVCIALDNLYLQKKHTFTANMVASILRCSPTNRSNPPDFVRQVEESIDKLRCTILNIELSDESGYSENVFYLSKYYKESRGRRIAMYEFVHSGKTPIALRYAMDRHMVYPVEEKAYLMPNQSKNTNRTIVTNYIATRIGAMKASKKISRSIIFSTILKKIQVGEESHDYNWSYKIRQYIKELLDNYVTEGYIAGYEFTRRGKEYDKILIRL